MKLINLQANAIEKEGYDRLMDKKKEAQRLRELAALFSGQSGDGPAYPGASTPPGRGSAPRGHG